MTMTNNDNNGDAITTLRRGFMRFSGCTEDEAARTFAVIVAGYGMRPDQLPELIRKLEVPELGMRANPVLLWLYSTVQMSRTSTGRTLMIRAAKTMKRVQDTYTRHERAAHN